jgi:hypothetical protein
MPTHSLIPVELFEARRVVALAAPVLLIASMRWIFREFNRRYGYPLGYLLAFVVYWVGWCTLLPAGLLGGFDHLLDVFRPFPPLATLDWKMHLLLWWPMLFPLFFVFSPGLHRINWRILVVSALLGVIIGVTEEMLWRGVYLRLFPGNAWLNLAYPTLMFALWHLASLSVRPNRLPGGVLTFVVYAVFLGASYALAATMMGSIAWTTISHVIHDSLGLGALPYGAWLGSETARGGRVIRVRPHSRAG